MKKNIIKTILAVLSVFILNSTVFGQQSNLSDSQLQLWNTTEFPSLGATFSQSLTNSTNANMNLLLDTSETTGASLFITANEGSADAVATYVITDNNTYSEGNYIEIKLKSVVNGVTPISNLTYTLETSLDGVSYTPLLAANNAESYVSVYNYDITLNGFAASNYKYVRLKITLKGLRFTDRRADVTLYSIKKIASGKHHETLDANTRTPLVSPAFDIKIDEDRTGLLAGLPIVIGSIVDGANRVIDSDLTNSGNMFSGISVNLGTKAGIGVKKLTGSYSVNTYLGFRISLTQVVNVDLGSGFEIVTYLGNQEQERIQGLSTILGVGALSASSQIDLGFNITKPADAFQIVYTSALVSIGGITVHYPLITRYEEGPNVACGQKGTLTLPEYPLSYNYNVESGVTINIANDLGIKDLDKVFDSSSNTYASIYSTVGINVASTKYINVFKSLSKFKKGSFYGFDVMIPSLANIDIVGSTKLFFLDNGVKVDSAVGADLIAINVPLLVGPGRNLLGFKAEQDFDQIQLAIEIPVGVNAASAFMIYDFIQQSFCKSPDLYVNELRKLSYPEFGIYIDSKTSGFNSSLLSTGNVSNFSGAIDDIDTTATNITVPASVGGTFNYTVKDATKMYGPNTYMAFDISFASLLNLDLLNSFEIVFLRDGIVVDSITSNNLVVGVAAGLLSGATDRKMIGAMAKDSFNSVQLRINYGIASVGLGNISINGLYGAALEKRDFICNTSYDITLQNSTAFIDYSKSGSNGLLNLGQIENIDAIIDTISDNYSTITQNITLGSYQSVAVQNMLGEYPRGSFAGFKVEETNTLLQLDLFNNITIVTYLNDTIQETATGNKLLDLTLLGLNLTGSTGVKNVGFNTTKPFDAIELRVGGFLNVNLNLGSTLKVYGAVVDTRSAFIGSVVCFGTAPDFNSSYIGTVTNGDLSTNDILSGTVSYGTPIADTSNPSVGVVFIVNADGTYTFTATEAGNYSYQVPVCVDSQTTGCATELVTFTILDPKINENVPAINPDVRYVPGGETQTVGQAINVLVNDGITSPMTTLDSNSITIVDSATNGTVTIDTNFNIIYTPNIGFYGKDEFWYKVCETPLGNCDSTLVKVYVIDTNYVDIIVAVNDYKILQQGVTTMISAKDGVLANDIHPKGGDLSLVNSDQVIPGVGSIKFNTNGSYEFISEAGFSGPVVINYTVVADTSTNNPLSSIGTLHLLVKAVPDLRISTAIQAPNFVLASPTSSTLVVRLNEINGVITKSSEAPIYVIVYKNSDILNYTFDSISTSVMAPVPTTVNNSEFEVVNETNTLILFKLKDGIDIFANEVKRFAINITLKSTAPLSTPVLKFAVSNGSGGEINNTNNISNRIINIQ